MGMRTFSLADWARQARANRDRVLHFGVVASGSRVYIQKLTLYAISAADLRAPTCDAPE